MTQQEHLSTSECQELLSAARRTLEEYLAHRRMPIIEHASGKLLERRGAFVTLHKGKQLRGCIGTFESENPLLDTIQRMAVAAATSDPRFPPVKPAELPEIHLEISVLSPLARASAEEVRVGSHGVYITRGMHRGVLLPQVAVENGWDERAFLEHTCMKAGLPVDAWKDPQTIIELFTAEVFGEDPRP